MPKSWSNTKVPPPLSPAERARLPRPVSVTLFSVALWTVAVFFLALTLYTAFHAVTHPPTQPYTSTLKK